ncbi:MAG: efflux RND transporter periplasmic adaptor subunit [Saprospiraceae bacterium]|nr:efflux RND transporter periplasmic adaptor subunit [Saprospiraceae bacterium]
MKNIVTQLSVLLTLSLIFIGCGSQPDQTPVSDKQTRLTEIKKQIAALNAEASALELELNPEGKIERSKVVGVQLFPPMVFKSYIDLQGSVTADQELYINAKMPGTTEKILIKTGDYIKEGQTVLTLDDAVLKQGLAELEAQLAFANDIFEKQKALWDQKIGTEVQYLSAKNNKESLEKRIVTTKEQWDMSKVKAPISGVIDEVMVKPGQTISPGIPIARLVNFSKLKINANVPESYAGRIKPGNAIKIYFPDIQKEYDSKVSYVSPIINRVNRTFNVEAALPANMSGVLPNMISILKIVDYVNPQAYVIPINLLQRDSQGDYIMVADSSGSMWKATKKMVIIGKFYNDQVEVKSGLEPTSKVITRGYQDLIEGENLTVQNN